jgi:hypothetical protein
MPSARYGLCEFAQHPNRFFNPQRIQTVGAYSLRHLLFYTEKNWFDTAVIRE